MSKQNISKIISAVVGLVLIGISVWQASTGKDSQALLYAGLLFLGGAGTVGLSRIAEPTATKRARRRTPPTLPILMLLVSGCGASSLALQADAAMITGQSLSAVDATLVNARAVELDAVLTEAQVECAGSVSGCTPERGDAYMATYDAIVSRWRAVLSCRLPVVEAVRAWIASIGLASSASSEELGLASVIPLALRAVTLYSSLVECVANVSDFDLPALPDSVLSLVLGATL